MELEFLREYLINCSNLITALKIRYNGEDFLDYPKSKVIRKAIFRFMYCHS